MLTLSLCLCLLGCGDSEPEMVNPNILAESEDVSFESETAWADEAVTVETVLNAPYTSDSEFNLGEYGINSYIGSSSVVKMPESVTEIGLKTVMMGTDPFGEAHDNGKK